MSGHVVTAGGYDLQLRHVNGQTCDLCRKRKPLQAFRFNARSVINGGYSRNCLDCERKRKAEKARDSHLRRTYGISARQYDDMLIAQGHRCAICKNKCSTGRRLSVDHDHETGRVRGLLCSKCNRAVGLMADNVARFVDAAGYLHKT